MTDDIAQLLGGDMVRYSCDLAEDDDHDTVTVFVRCTYCRRYAVGGYECETCGHDTSVKPHQLPGHGPGVCT